MEWENCSFLIIVRAWCFIFGVADDGAVVCVLDADVMQKKVAERIRDDILLSAFGIYDIASK